MFADELREMSEKVASDSINNTVPEIIERIHIEAEKAAKIGDRSIMYELPFTTLLMSGVTCEIYDNICDTLRSEGFHVSSAGMYASIKVSW